MTRIILMVFTALLIAACGTVPTPVFEAPPATATAAPDGEAVAAVASSTPIPATATSTPVPPTSTATEAPTEAPTEEAEAAPAQDLGANDPLKFFVDLASASNGEALFNQNFETSSGVWACTQCHNIDIDEVKIGPSLLGIPAHAATRVEGEGPYTYIYNSIAQSQAYIVSGFENMVMMPHYGTDDSGATILTQAQIYDLVAYLMTLEG